MSVDNYIIETAAASDPVTLAEARAYLRIDDDITDDDTLITALISAATSQGEKYTNRIFVTRTFTGYFAYLQRSCYEIGPYLQIRRGPLVSLTSVKSVIDGTPTDVDAGDYELKQQSGFSRLIFPSTQPEFDPLEPYPYQLEFVAGYAVVPEDIKLAIKAHVLFMYENRGDVVPDGGVMMPNETVAIYSRYRIVNTFG